MSHHEEAPTAGTVVEPEICICGVSLVVLEGFCSECWDAVYGDLT